MANSVEPPTDVSAYTVEFRATADDAWYSIRLVLDGDILIVKFWTFPDYFDEKFSAGDFKTAQAVDDFCRRFRQVSEQAQDHQCPRIIQGMTVCASLVCKDDDVRFYDAIVEFVNHVEHSYADGEEICLCSFVLSWQHGPNRGYLTTVNIANICLIQPDAQVDCSLVSFSQIAKEKPKPMYSQCTCQELTNSWQSHTRMLSTEGMVSSRMSDLDEDLGADSYEVNCIGETGGNHYIIIDNLEKDLSPLTMVEFIHKQTSVVAQVFIFPSFLFETYTRGAIVSDSKRKLKNIYDFLINPDHIIMSSKGRPWVITEKRLRWGMLRTTFGSITAGSQCVVQNGNVDDELKVARLGTKEYATGQRLRDLLIEFVEHQRRLQTTLALEERKILQPSHAA